MLGKRRTALVGIFVFAILFLMGIIYAHAPESEKTAARYVRGIGAREEVYIKDRPILVVDDSIATSTELSAGDRVKALHLMRAATMLRRSAILALPDTSLDLLSESIERYPLLRDEIADVQKTIEDARAVHDGLMPIDTWRRLVALEKARRAFLAHPSEDLLHAYTVQLPGVIDSYIRDASAYHAMFVRYKDPKSLHGVVAGTLTAASEDAFLRRTIGQARALSSEARQYVRCLQGTTFFCDARWLAPPSLSAITEPAVSEAPPPPERVVNLVAKLMVVHFGPHNNGVRVRIPSVCNPTLNVPFEYVVPTYDRSDEFARPVRGIEDVYFLRFQDKEYKNTMIDAFVDAGAKLSHVALNAVNVCHETQVDTSRAVGTADLYAMLKQIAPKSATGLYIGTSGNRYLAADLVAKRAQELLASGALDRDAQHAIEDMVLALALGTAGYDKHLAALADTFHDHVRAQKKNIGSPLGIEDAITGWDGVYSKLLLFHLSLNPEHEVMVRHVPLAGRPMFTTVGLQIDRMSYADLWCGMYVTNEYHRGIRPSSQACAKAYAEGRAR